jgi:predicted  nucleic acid-binding Zn-ribbon protein
MEVMEQLVLLAELNELEVRLRRTKERIIALPAEAEIAEKQSEVLRKKLNAKSSIRLEADKKQRSLELNLDSEKDHLRKWQKRLEQIREEREYAALSSEIGAQKKAIGNRESQILDVMEEVEELDKEILVFQTEFDEALETAKNELDKVSAELGQERESAEKGQKAREALLAKLPVPLVKKYQRIAERRQGQGVAILKGETCTACFNTVRPQMAILICKGELIETCNSCQRILVDESATKSTEAEEALADAAAL